MCCSPANRPSLSCSNLHKGETATFNFNSSVTWSFKFHVWQHVLKLYTPLYVLLHVTTGYMENFNYAKDNIPDSFISAGTSSLDNSSCDSESSELQDISTCARVELLLLVAMLDLKYFCSAYAHK